MVDEARIYVPGLRGRFGDWAYYSVLMRLSDIAQRIDFARDLHKSNALSQLIQRELKGGRAEEIARYIKENEDRFFNSLVVAIYGGQPAWHQFEIRPSTDVSEEALDDTELYSLGFLSLTSSEKIFALDGQHRLAGIKKAVLEEPSLGSEELSVIFVAHHKTPAGEKRTRKLFTTLNKEAKPVSKSEIIALDESDAMAISTRYLVEEHRFFDDQNVDTLRKQANLPPSDKTHFTTIINLYDVLSIVFPFVKQRLARDKITALRIYRPSDEEIAEYNSFAGKYFELLGMHFPEMAEYFDAKTESRPGILAKHRRPTGGHVLFRPLGLKLFAELLKELRSRHSLEVSFQLIAKLPVALEEVPYRDVIWEPGTGRMLTRGAALCRQLLLHMLGEKGAKAKDLRRRYAQALEKDEKDVELPKILA